MLSFGKIILHGYVIGLFYTVCRQEAFGTFVVFSVSALLFLVADEHDGVLYSSLIHPLRSRFSPSWGEAKTYPSCQWCFKLNWCACSDPMQQCCTMVVKRLQHETTPQTTKEMLHDVARKFDENQTLSKHRATSCNIVQHVACNNVAWNVANNDTCKIGTFGQPHPYTTAGKFDLFGPSGGFGTSGPMGVAHGTQKCWQKLIKSKHSFDQIHFCATWRAWRHMKPTNMSQNEPDW